MNPLEFASKNPIHSEPTIIDHLSETGIYGQLSVVVFLIGIVFAGWIHFRQLSFRYRIAFIPFSLLPFMIGVFGLAVGTIEIIHSIREGAVRIDGYGILEEFGETLQVIPLTSIETIALMIVSIILLVLGKENLSKPNQSEQSTSSNGDKPQN